MPDEIDAETFIEELKSVFEADSDSALADILFSSERFNVLIKFLPSVRRCENKLATKSLWEVCMLEDVKLALSRSETLFEDFAGAAALSALLVAGLYLPALI